MSTNGSLSFVSAHEAAIDVGGTGLNGMTPELLHRASALPFKKKLHWFRQCRDKLKIDWQYVEISSWILFSTFFYKPRFQIFCLDYHNIFIYCQSYIYELFS
jgi:hypothetical protein